RTLTRPSFERQAETKGLWLRSHDRSVFAGQGPKSSTPSSGRPTDLLMQAAQQAPIDGPQRALQRALQTPPLQTPPSPASPRCVGAQGAAVRAGVCRGLLCRGLLCARCCVQGAPGVGGGGRGRGYRVCAVCCGFAACVRVRVLLCSSVVGSVRVCCAAGLRVLGVLCGYVYPVPPGGTPSPVPAQD